MPHGQELHIHDHSLHHDHEQYHLITDNIRVAFLLNISFTIIEIIGGLYTNSIAILSDAVHDLGDSLSLAFSWYFQKISNKSRDKKFTFGYKRFSLIGAIVNSVVLVIGSVIIISEAIPRFWTPQQPYADGMIFLAIIGIIVNGAAVFRLKKGSSLNERVVSLHFLEDVLGWVAVFIAAIVMKFIKAPFLDPFLSVLIACYVLYNAYKNMRKSFKIILQGTPSNVSQEDIRKKLNRIPAVKDIHDVHLWTMDGEYNVLTLHVVLTDNYSLNKLSTIKRDIYKVLKSEQIHHITIEFESQEEECIFIDC